MSDNRRQEFILLSGVLGVSILLAAIKKNKKTQFRIRTKHLS